jgi:hypothetical protein
MDLHVGLGAEPPCGGALDVEARYVVEHALALDERAEGSDAGIEQSIRSEARAHFHGIGERHPRLASGVEVEVDVLGRLAREGYRARVR